MKKLKSFFCLLLVLLMLPTVAAMAVGNIDTEREPRLTLRYFDGDTPIVGAHFELYKIASANAYGELTVTKDFEKYGIEELIASDDSWKLLASTLEGYVVADELRPADSGETNVNGILSFPTEGKSLSNGLYLVVGERHIQNGVSYEPSSFVVMLPTYDSQGDAWLYDVMAQVKFESGSATDTVDRTVIKLWDDKGNESSRPKEIKVQLLRNGEVHDTAVLNADNSWRYKWEGLDPAYTWKVVEEVPDGYAVTIERDGTVFMITNTPDGDTPDTPHDPSLPQTGQLWWPVPVLAAAGLILLTLGLISKKRDAND